MEKICILCGKEMYVVFCATPEKFGFHGPADKLEDNKRGFKCKCGYGEVE